MSRFLAAALLLGGLRDPRLAALGEAAVFAAVWRRRPALGPARPWLPWLAWAFLSALLSLQPLAGLQPLARWSAVLAFYSLAAAWDEAERERWLKTLLAAGAVLGAAALWSGAPYGFRADMTGLIPPYYNYTMFALAACVAAGAAWALHPRTERREFRLAGAAVAVLGAVCLALARSRGAFLGVVFAALVWAARRWGAKAGLAALLTAAAAAAIFQSDFHRRGVYQEARPEIWHRAAEIAGANAWLGAGPGNYGAAFRLHPVEARGGRARWGLGTDYAHSEPLQAAAETGWVGEALWLGALAVSLSVLLGWAREEPVREAAALAVAAMSVQLALDNMLQIPGLALLFFAALAVAGPASRGGRPWPWPAAALGVLLALIGWLPRVLADRDPAWAALLFPRESYPREDLAYRAMAAGNLAQADALWAQAEERAPYDAVYSWRRAQIAAAMGRWEESRALAERAAATEPGFLNDRVLHALALVRLGRRDEARAELSAVMTTFHARGNRAGSSAYDATIWEFDRKEYDRVAAFVGRAPNRRR